MIESKDDDAGGQLGNAVGNADRHNPLVLRQIQRKPGKMKVRFPAEQKVAEEN